MSAEMAPTGHSAVTRMADQWIMTAVGVLARPVAGPSVDLTGTLTALRSPNLLSGVVLAGLVVVVVGQHPIARVIGTEVAVPRTQVAATDVALTAPPAVRGPAVAAPVPIAVPTHAPRDPFRPLASAAAPSVAVAPSAPAATAPPATTPVAVARADRYVVQAGDSLWGIAQKLLGTSATMASTQRLVEQIYTRNADVIGADPSLLHVGQTLDLAGLR